MLPMYINEWVTTAVLPGRKPEYSDDSDICSNVSDDNTGSFEIPQVSAYYKPLSLRLFSLLDDIGASEELRKVWMENQVTREILDTLYWHPEASVYCFGSRADGTTTIGMKSDLDIVRILNTLPVVTDPQDHPVGNSLLFIQDDTTPAGYCKLQLVQDGVPQCGEIPKSNPYLDTYCRDRLQFTRDTDTRLVCCFKPNKYATSGIDQRHGPALTRNATQNVTSVDTVHAVECQSTSRSIHIWLNRKRNFNWPTDDILQTCSNLGCLFVPVGHPKSVDTEQEQQWRISFSHQEKLLVSQFSPVQYKCFIVLKMIKKFKKINPEAEPDSLSSYHVKTCMFYAIENTSCTLWKPENLLLCISLCLRKLLEWMHAGYCPNYFIPEENMFNRRVHGIVRKRLQTVLHQLVSADCTFLTSIKCDELGQRLLQYYLVPGVTTADEDQSDYYCTLSKLIELRNFCSEAFYFGILHHTDICDRSLDSSLNEILKSLSALLNTSTITRHTVEETQRAKSLILPYLELSLMSNVVASAVDQNQNNADIRRLLTSIRWKEISLSSDLFSSRLKQASMLYMLGDYQTSLNVLSSLTGLVRYTLCNCYLDKDIIVLPDDATLLQATDGIPDVTPHCLLRNVFIPCVYFLPTEKSVTPAALCYEMERMRGPRPDSDDDLCRHDRDRGDWAFVDGNFLLHLLLYLNHSKLYRTKQAYANINSMRQMLEGNNATRVSHRDACLNLLGWVFKEEGNYDRAELCFAESLHIKEYCNATYQHYSDMSVYLAKSQNQVSAPKKRKTQQSRKTASTINEEQNEFPDVSSQSSVTGIEVPYLQQRIHDLQQQINELRLQVHNLSQQARQPLPYSKHDHTVRQQKEIQEIILERLNPEDKIQYLQQQAHDLRRQINDIQQQLRDLPHQVTYLRQKINSLQQECIRLSCVLTLTRLRNRWH